ncbi:hypothetical protein GCM10023310_43510 [Paenibacillus vulneris]
MPYMTRRTSSAPKTCIKAYPAVETANMISPINIRRFSPNIANNLAANNRITIADMANRLITKLIVVPLLPNLLDT